MVAPPAGAGRNGHIASLRLLNKERWEAQLKEQQSTGNHLFNRPNPFFQGDPNAKAAKFVKPYVRTKHPDRNGDRLGPMRGTVHWVNENGKLVNDEKLSRFKRENPDGALRFENGTGPLRYVPVYEDDMSIPIDSSEKYRIPYTSVVNKVGDCKLFFCCGWRLTAAQWSPSAHSNRAKRSELTRAGLRAQSGGSTFCASRCTSRWSSSPSTLPTGSTG